MEEPRTAPPQAHHGPVLGSRVSPTLSTLNELGGSLDAAQWTPSSGPDSFLARPDDPTSISERESDCGDVGSGRSCRIGREGDDEDGSITPLITCLPESGVQVTKTSAVADATPLGSSRKRACSRPRCGTPQFRCFPAAGAGSARGVWATHGLSGSEGHKQFRASTPRRPPTFARARTPKFARPPGKRPASARTIVVLYLGKY